MDKKELRIEKGHTLIEYRYCYGRLFDKGKILSFNVNEKDLMNNKYRYWELKDEDGKIKYFQLPNGLFRSDYNVSKHKHKKPFILSMIVLAVAAAGACTSFVITNTICKKNNIDEVTDPEYSAIWDKYIKLKNEGKDPYDNMSLDELVNVGIAKFVYKAKDNRYMTVGRGSTITNVPIISPVRVEVRNALIRNGDNSLEESDSYSFNIFAPKVGKRDYCFNNEVITYNGTASSAEDVSFSDEVISKKDKKEFKEMTGKDVHFPFLYTISNETVLVGEVKDVDPVTGQVHNGSKKSRDEQGNMTFYIELHNQKSISKYVKRMYYLSGKKPEYFNYINMTFVMDKNFDLIETNINEKYDVGNEMFSLPTEGTMKTRYYTKDVIDIPDVKTKFDYSKYPF